MRFKVELDFYIDDESLNEDAIKFMLYGMIDERNKKTHSQISNFHCRKVEKI